MPSSTEVDGTSEFYWYCRNRNYSEVKTMLSELLHEQINQIEPNGSTALHVATS
jgi:hypothetical protein